MAGLRDTLEKHVRTGSVPGAVGLVARGDRVEVEAVGAVDVEGTAPMARDSIFRIASITKPVVAAAVMMLVEDGRIALDDPVGQWLPELASPSVVRTPAAPVDDVVPAVRPITVFHLLSSRAGYGFPSDFSLPAVAPLFSELKQGPPQPQTVPAPDEWMAALSRIPLLHQPGEGWLYNISSDLQGVLIARVTGRPLPEFLAERLFEPLGMADTAFAVPADKLHRFTGYYRTDPEGSLELVDAADGQWSSPPAFPSGAGGLVSTADDWLAFGRMLLAEGTVGGRRLLTPESVRQMTTNHLTPSERESGGLFLEGMGWGLGGAVDVEAVEPWSVPGRYGWVGGTGTTAHITPSTGAVTIMLSQLQMGGPSFPELMRDFWRYAAGA
ncbi:serine hydrolase domain-containing protein [Streptomyces sp. NBC_01750]|uniref:serine hydrolase domain-containing protein n=1 Tax=Streptomyces sp. NBC_01750 TaxID=2975928 RepID=UPI002DDBF835|nr:serine hydrolase domain-containing protein [Streptomyces sp. NBC_01750]WSD30888.1 beta-lactamase family protein [Streptomyces sp. NBC_01750]